MTGALQVLRTASVALVLVIMPLRIAAQDVITEWRLTGPDLEVGRSGIELFAVRSVAALPDGGIAIANGGTSQIFIISADGKLVRTFGRRGKGPEEFESIASLNTVGDTLIVYASGYVSVWLLEDGHQATYAKAAHGNRFVSVEDVISSGVYVATSRTSRGTESPEGLYEEHRDVLLVQSASRQVAPVAKGVLWLREYHYVNEQGGTTTYPVPFLGRTHLVVSSGSIVLAPLDSTYLRVVGTGDRRDRVIMLPLRRLPFNRSLIESYRDSAIAAMSPAARRMFPFEEAQLREVYDDDVPIPEHAPLLSKMTAVGDQVWVQVYPRPDDANATWYVVEPSRGRVAGRLTLPKDWDVMGGSDDGSVFVLRRDELGVEYIQVYTVVAG